MRWTSLIRTIPKALWEFSEATKLGLTFGNPIITKRGSDGKWIVAFSSGYNNADGIGRLFILDAITGAPIQEIPNGEISTGVGTSGTPSGLGKINAWVETSTNNTALRFYGGDMLGNLWRFDFDNLVEPKRSALLLARLQTPEAGRNRLPIKPETILISKTHPAVVVGTGRYLGDSDISNTDKQSLYIIKETLATTGLGILRNNPKMVKRTVTVSGTSVTGTTEKINWNTDDGWWFDLPNSGERVVNSMSLLSGTLFVPSAVPSGYLCLGRFILALPDRYHQGLSDNPIGMLFSRPG